MVSSISSFISSCSAFIASGLRMVMIFTPIAGVNAQSSGTAAAGGAASGILIPELHKIDDENFSFSPVFSPDYKGLYASYRF